MRVKARPTGILIPILLLLSAVAAPAGHATPPVTSTKNENTIQLGSVAVHGQKQILAALQAIKIALHSPFSSDKAHENDVVCRISKAMAEAREYLTCATNRTFAHRRMITQTDFLITQYIASGVGGTTRAMESIVGAQPNHMLHMPVNGGALQALLNKLPAPQAAKAAAEETPDKNRN